MWIISDDQIRFLCAVALSEAASLGLQEKPMSKKRKHLRGKVERVIKPIVPTRPEKAEIGIVEADDLYREIRIENVVTDEKGEKARLRPGAKVDVVVEADTDATTKMPEDS